MPAVTAAATTSAARVGGHSAATAHDAAYRGGPFASTRSKQRSSDTWPVVTSPVISRGCAQHRDKRLDTRAATRERLAAIGVDLDDDCPQYGDVGSDVAPRAAVHHDAVDRHRS